VRVVKNILGLSALLVATITFAGSPAQRVIALSPHAVEMLFLLGAGERIVATTKFADFPEQALSIPRIGGYNGIQIEKILALNPDLIIAWEDGNKTQDIEQMEKLGLNVYRSQTRSLDQIAQELITFGEMLGLETKGKRAAEQFTQRLKRIRDVNQNKRPVRFFYQLWDEPLRAMAAGSWINTVMESCQGVNVFDDPSLDYPQVSIENVLVSAPEAFVVPSHHGTLNANADRWKKWPEIPAIANNHIYFIEGDLLHRFSTRILDGMERVCLAFDKVRAQEGAKRVANKSRK